MTKFTPGPWKITKVVPKSPTNSSYAHIIGTDDFPRLLTIYGTSDEAKANAQLIATAPELRYALRDAIAAMNNIPGFDTGLPSPSRPDHNMGSYELLAQLDALIRKTEGRS